MTEGQDLTLTVGDRAWTHHAAVGAFEWNVFLSLDVATELSMQISANRQWQPSSSNASTDSRELAWYVAAIEAR